MKCKSCGANLNDEKFCPYCGLKVEVQETNKPKTKSKQGISVVLYQKNNKFAMYYPYCIDTDDFADIERCKKQARMHLEENIGDYEPLSEKELLNNKHTQKLINKGYDVKIGFLEVNIKKLLADFEDACDDYDDDYAVDDDEDDFWIDNSSNKRIIKNNNLNKIDASFGFCGVYAYIEKGGLFYEGDIPGLNFCKANFCHSYEECLNTLREKLQQQSGRAFFEMPKQNLNEIKHNHPNAKIIRL